MSTRTRLSVASVALALLSPLSDVPTYARSESTLVEIVRAATEGFGNPQVAVAQGWTARTGCVSGPQGGAMGTHLINPALLGDAELDPARPEALIYERKPGRTALVGVEFIVLADVWHASHAAPPVLLGQHLHYVGSPNRYGLPPFYELHVWAWKNNPSGTFADWHPHVSCDDVIGRSIILAGDLHVDS